MGKAASLDVEHEGRRVRLTNLDKMFYPEAGFTKGDVVNYYASVAHVLLPHLKDRALTLKRYPDGVTGEFFYQKEAPAPRPDWFQVAPLYSRHREKTIHYCLANDLPSLLWLVNAADLEFHAFLSKRDDASKPTAMVYDLDPGAPADIHHCCQVALELRNHLDRYGLQAFPKTSGSKGMQVYVPLNTPTTFDDTKTWSRAAAMAIERAFPKRVTSNMRKDLRAGKVFIDWSQNTDHKTTVCVYSLRAKPKPTASTPVTWEEVEKAARYRRVDLSFEAKEVIRRVEAHGDLFKPVLKLKQDLPKLQETS